MDRERRTTARGGPPKPSGRPSKNLMSNRASTTIKEEPKFVPFSDESDEDPEDMFKGMLKPAQPRSRGVPPVPVKEENKTSPTRNTEVPQKTSSLDVSERTKIANAPVRTSALTGVEQKGRPGTTTRIPEGGIEFGESSSGSDDGFNFDAVRTEA